LITKSNSFKIRYFIYLSLICIAFIFGIRIFSPKYKIHETNGEFHVIAPKKWKLYKKGFTDLLVSSSNDTIYWERKRADKLDWKHYMRNPLELDRFHDGALDTLVDLERTVKNRTLLIRTLSPYKNSNNDTMVCYQMGLYSSSRFNFMYIMLPLTRYKQIKNEIKSIWLSIL
jgi:hypothetical protein